MSDDLDDVMERRLHHIERIEFQLRTIEQKLDMITKAFPEGDLAGHRRAHELMIAEAARQDKLWQELKLDIMKYLVRGIMLVMVALILSGLSVEMLKTYLLKQPAELAQKK